MDASDHTRHAICAALQNDRLIKIGEPGQTVLWSNMCDPETWNDETPDVEQWNALKLAYRRARHGERGATLARLRRFVEKLLRR